MVILGYDSHIILKALSKKQRKLRLQTIGKSLENLISLRIGKYLEIKDTRNFLPTSLEKLVKSLKSKVDSEKRPIQEVFKYTFNFFKANYGHVEDEHFPLLINKFVYPYSYFNSFAKFEVITTN